MKDLVIFGTGAFADLAHYYFTHDSIFDVVGFTVDGAYLSEPRFKGLPVVPFEEVRVHFPPDTHSMFVALGLHRVNRTRAEKVAAAENQGYRLASFVSSRAGVHGDLVVHPNTMIMEHAVFHPSVEVGRNTIVWSASRIAFRTRIGHHCWVVSAILGESVVVGDYTFVGLNATIAPSVSIGDGNIVGAGAVIMENTRDGEVYRGHASAPSRAPSRRFWNTPPPELARPISSIILGFQRPSWPNPRPTAGPASQ
jgi:sugar O-acyltransferase (sialic acid O-acetyltransferase NeuD family)